MADLEMTVNLADPKDVRAKMPEIEGLLAIARQQLADLEAQVDLLERIAGRRPTSQASSTAASGKRARSKTRRKGRAAPKAAPAQERAIEALQLAGRAMGPAELFRFMDERGLSGANTVARLGSILWAAAGSGRLIRTDGKYAPTGGFSAHPAATNGQMSVSAQLPGPNGSGSPTAVLQTSPQFPDTGGGGRPRESEEE
jgi:hypothetical protein